MTITVDGQGIVRYLKIAAITGFILMQLWSAIMLYRTVRMTAFLYDVVIYFLNSEAQKQPSGREL